MHEIIPNIYSIPVPLPNNPLKELNAYLIKGPDRSLLIDTGFNLPPCREALLAGLAEAGADRSRLDVLVTHIHTDHTGLSVEMAGPNGKVYIGALDYPFTAQAFEDQFWVEMDARFLKEGFPEEEVAIITRTNPARNLGPKLDLDCYVPVEEGEVFQIGDYRLEVLSVPGHAPGQLCLWMERVGILFTADHVLFDITPNISVWANMDNMLGRYLESLKRIRTYPVKLALPAHRHSGDLNTRIDQLIQHHRDRVAETLSIVEKYPGMTAYDITGRMTWDIRAKSWEDFPLNQKWFAVGEALAHLELLIREGTVKQILREDGMFGYTT
ncbi:MAG: MBL fold metallo-hydrolase [Ruminiclostridium sp.]|nr:MBL fold metallo-hydrolase [Ruminiclostridium sp.]